MSEKEKKAMERFEQLFKNMSDRELENLLLVGEGMVIMAGIKDTREGEESKKAG